MRVATEALFRVHRVLQGKGRILDVGSGKGEHAKWFKERGYKVITTDIAYEPVYKGDFNKIAPKILELEGTFDCVWCSHVLEHQSNPGEFLRLLKSLSKTDIGLIAITVPPRKDNLVGGHLNLYTPLSLIYNVILSGVDCSLAGFKQYGYNMSLVARNHRLPPQVIKELKYDRGDIETLSKYFPVEVQQNIDGFSLTEVNWG